MDTRAFARAIVGTAILISLASCRGPVQNEGEQASATPSQPSDADIVTAVRAKFYTDSTLRGQDVNVSAANGIVTLEGDVGSITVQTRAVELARSVDGVSEVQDQMTPGVPGPATAGRQGERTGQPSVRTRVLAAYFRTPAVKGSQIDVTAGSTGAVTLEGEVNDAAARDRAEQVARAVEGVTDVDNRLHVRSGAEQDGSTAALSDDAIKARVQSRFFTDADTKAQNIDVRVAQGIVTLSGSVDDARSRRTATAIARNTPGVQRVEANLTVDENATTGTSGTPGLASRLAGTTSRVEDSWITTQVQASFFADPQIKARDIDVQTRAGVVTLTGEVGSNEAKSEAADIAKEIDGVTRVVNRLTVRDPS